MQVDDNHTAQGITACSLWVGPGDGSPQHHHIQLLQLHLCEGGLIPELHEPQVPCAMALGPLESRTFEHHGRREVVSVTMYYRHSRPASRRFILVSRPCLMARV